MRAKLAFALAIALAIGAVACKNKRGNAAGRDAAPTPKQLNSQ